MTVTTPLAETRARMSARASGWCRSYARDLGWWTGFSSFCPKRACITSVCSATRRRWNRSSTTADFSEHKPVDIAFVLDPMLATGGSACVAVARLKKWGVKKIKYLGLFAAPEGIRKLSKSHPESKSTSAPSDSHLNDRGYIVPGMGDAGDRQFSGE